MKKNFFYVSAIAFSLVLASCGAKSEEKETTEAPAIETPAPETTVVEKTTKESIEVEDEAPIEEKVQTIKKPAVKPVVNKETPKPKSIEESAKKIKEELNKETFKNVENVEGEGRGR